jgi:hypothetical protein
LTTVVGKGRQSLPCIVCGKLLQNVEGTVNQPYGGTMFYTYGHYGSTAFDPMLGHTERLMINVCDACLTAAAGQRLVLMQTEQHQPAPELVTVIWVPGEEDEAEADTASKAEDKGIRQDCDGQETVPPVL